MKKFLVLVLVLTFVVAAYAEDRLSMSGRFNVLGNYEGADLEDLGGGDGQKSYYESDFRIMSKIKADDATTANFRIDFKDVTWGTAGDTQNESKAKAFRVERAYLGHSFSNGLTLTAGLMTGGAWGTTYTDLADAKWRVKLVQKIAMGKVVAAVQKNVENGDLGNEDLEKDDSDTYILGAVLKAGGFNVKPLFFYTLDSNDGSLDSDGTKTAALRLAVDGKVGPLAVEGEFAFNNRTVDANSDADATAFGLYLDANMDMGAATVGASAIYASYDDDTGYAIKTFGDDWDDYMVVNDQLGLVGGAFNLVRVYAMFKPMEKVSADAYLTYAMDSDEADVKVTELDVTAKYSFSKAFFYQAGLGYMAIDNDGDTGTAYRLFHKVQVNF